MMIPVPMIVIRSRLSLKKMAPKMLAQMICEYCIGATITAGASRGGAARLVRSLVMTLCAWGLGRAALASAYLGAGAAGARWGSSFSPPLRPPVPAPCL